MPAIMAGFTVALPLAVAAGAPLSTALLELNGVLGIAGWKWMFIAESVPTVLIGIFFLLFVTDRPSHAHWLSGEERDWLIETLEEERKLIEATRKVSLWESFFEPRVLVLTLNYFGIVTASLGLLLFLPQMVKQLGLTNMQVGWVSMLPYIFGALSRVAWGWVSDRMGERRWNLFIACVVAAVGLIIAGMTLGTAWAVVGMTICNHRTLRFEGPILDDAIHVPDRERGGIRHRLDQRHRQSRRILRTHRSRMDQDHDRKLRQWALSARRHGSGIGGVDVLA